MFSGLVKHIGIVKNFSGETITIKSDIKPTIGASIAVNGICLTATRYKNGEFDVVLSKESRDNIAIENLKDRVHLEEALTLNDRLDGHIVQGHIDCIGIIRKIEKNENGFDFYIEFDESKIPLIVPKGSIAIDGISLTINSLQKNIFKLTIIPHTFKNTLFHTYQINRRVNIETDIINRSIYHILKHIKVESAPNWRDIDSMLLSY